MTESSDATGVTLTAVFNMLKAIQKNLKESTEEAKVYKDELERTKERVMNLEYGQNIILDELNSLRKFVDNEETINRKNNLVLFNFPESQNETISILMDNFTALLNNKLHIDANKNEFDYVRRIGGRKARSPRPVLIRCITTWRKHELLSANPALKNEGMSLAEDLPPKTRRIRKELIPFMLEARQQGHQASLRRDRLMIDGALYSLDQLRKRREGRSRPLADDVTSSPMKRRRDDEISRKKVSERSAAALERFSFQHRRSSLPSTSDVDLTRSPPSKVPAK